MQKYIYGSTQKSLINLSIILLLTITLLSGGYQETSYSSIVTEKNIISVADSQDKKSKKNSIRQSLFDSLFKKSRGLRLKSVRENLSKIADNSSVSSQAAIESEFSQTAVLTANDGEDNDLFGESVSISDDTAIVGASYDDDHKGSAYIFVRNGTNWIQQAKLTADDGAAEDRFGFSVSISGNKAVIGAPVDDTGKGSAYIFVRNGANWTQQAKLVASDADNFEAFGYSLSISGDTTIVSSPLDDNGRGAAYIFQKNNLNWTQQQKLVAGDGISNDAFGFSVSISSDTAVISAPADDTEKGSAYVFSYNGTIWGQQAKLIDNNGEPYDNFGFCVSISDETVVATSINNNRGVGAAFVFIKNNENWTQQAKLIAENQQFPPNFGNSVSISKDTIVVGAIEGTVDGNDRGAAFVFVRSNGSWMQRAALAGPAFQQRDFGYSVSISGNTVAVGTRTGNSGKGAVYIFVRDTPNISNNTKFDFDGDGKADISVYRPNGGVWYLLQSNTGYSGTQFGISTDKIAPADYDGDGKTDLAVYRAGVWYLQRSQLGFTGISFGDSNDIPQPADFDGDGRAEIAVFRPSNGTWYVLNLVNNQFNAAQFGTLTDKPVVGDYDGDGKADFAVYRAGVWFIQRSGLGFMGVQFGDSADKCVPADYDGDGKTDIAVFRPSNGVWYLLRSTQGFTGMQFGISTDLPTPADYDGDGKSDVAVFRNGIWYLQRSSQVFAGIAFGINADIPIPNAFVK